MTRAYEQVRFGPRPVILSVERPRCRSSVRQGREFLWALFGVRSATRFPT